MTEDPRCCGSGMCIIDTEGRCWCGQRWNGQQMCAEPLSAAPAAPLASAAGAAPHAIPAGDPSQPQPRPD